MTTSRPNIICILTDQQSANAMSCAGNEHLHTPAMDQIASKGIRFDQAYTSFPLCIPARMSIFTSRMPHELGIFSNVHQSHENFTPLLSKNFSDQGYNCHYVGKWHLTVPEDQKEVHGFENIIFGGGYGGLDSEKTVEAVKFLQQDHNDPFFLVISYNNPHDCCEFARNEKLRMTEIPSVPSSDKFPPLPDNVGINPTEPSAIRQFQKDNPNIGGALNWDNNDICRYRWGYNRLVEAVDAEIGKIIDLLDQTNRWQDTILLFSSDHGDGQGCHNWNQKWCLYDEVSRVPFILVTPDCTEPGRIDNSLVSASLDLMPTLCDYASIEIPSNIHGQSIRSCAENKNSLSKREFIASETSFGNWGELHNDCWPKARMIRTKDYKYITYDSGNPREQLFNMVLDPMEKTNLAADKKYEKILQEHQKYLKKWINQTKDSFDPNN